MSNALWNWILKYSSKFSNGLKKLLVKDEEYGSRLAILFAQIALVLVWSSLWKTHFFPKLIMLQYFEVEVAVWFVFSHCSILVYSSKSLRARVPLHRRFGFLGNLVANIALTVSAILLEKFYEKTLGGLFCALSISLLLLMLLIIVRPWTDFGLFGFIIGITMAVSYNLYGLQIPIWLVLAIFLMYGFKCWLDQNWLGEELPQPYLDKSFPDAMTLSSNFLVCVETSILTVFFWNMYYGSQERTLSLTGNFFLFIISSLQLIYFVLYAMIMSGVVVVTGIFVIVSLVKFGIDKFIVCREVFNSHLVEYVYVTLMSILNFLRENRRQNRLCV